MTITTKYDIGQTVWRFIGNELKRQKILEIRVRKARVFYMFSWDEWAYSESQLFATIEEAKESVEVEG